jgi:hypothetical protein
MASCERHEAPFNAFVRPKREPWTGAPKSWGGVISRASFGSFQNTSKPFVKQLIGISIAAVLRDRMVDLKLV